MASHLISGVSQLTPPVLYPVLATFAGSLFVNDAAVSHILQGAEGQRLTQREVSRLKREFTEFVLKGDVKLDKFDKLISK